MKIKTKYSMVFKNIKRTFIDNNKRQSLVQSIRWKKEDKKEWEECRLMQEELKLKFTIKIKCKTQTIKSYQKKEELPKKSDIFTFLV